MQKSTARPRSGARAPNRTSVGKETSRGHGSIVAVCVSPSKGMRKKPVASARAVEGQGIDGDAHAGDSTRQVSLLALESVRKITEKGLDLGPGDFAENITTEGIDLCALKIGDRLCVGGAVLEISQIGKVCHSRCAIFERAGDCVMPREGVFARVIAGGMIEAGGEITHCHPEPFDVAQGRLREGSPSARGRGDPSLCSG